MSREADQRAARRITDVVPAWTGMMTAAEAMGLPDGTLLHAGPPFPSQQDLPAPILHAAVHASLFEDWAANAEAARTMIEGGEIILMPAQPWRACAPLAAVISPSMWLHVVTDAVSPARCAYAPINAGMTLPLPHGGADDPAVLDRLWLVNEEIAPRLRAALDDPIEILPLIDASLRSGDECHGSTAVGSALIRECLAKGNGITDDDLLAFLDQAPGFFLFLMMAASKVMMMAAEDIPDAAIVTTAGGNGQRFGICLACAPERWIMTDGTPPNGPLPENAKPLAAIGDSAVIDALGFGGLALDACPVLLTMLEGRSLGDVTTLPELILEATHPALFDGRWRVALNARKVVQAGRMPPAVLGMLDAAGKAGIIGRGLYEAPVDLFEKALGTIGEN